MGEDAVLEAKSGHFILDNSHIHIMTFAFICFYACISLTLAVYSRFRNKASAEQTGE